MGGAFRAAKSEYNSTKSDLAKQRMDYYEYWRDQLKELNSGNVVSIKTA
jgi:hypothetical protein